jgi:hypothetical protein
LPTAFEEEVAEGAAVQCVQLVSGRTAFGVTSRAYEMQFDDARHDRFVGDHRGVLADGDRSPKRRFVRLVAGGLDAFVASVPPP